MTTVTATYAAFVGYIKRDADCLGAADAPYLITLHGGDMAPEIMDEIRTREQKIAQIERELDKCLDDICFLRETAAPGNRSD